MTSTSTLAELSDIYLTGFNSNRLGNANNWHQLNNSRSRAEGRLQAPSAVPARTICTHNAMLELEYKCQTRAVTKGLVIGDR